MSKNENVFYDKTFSLVSYFKGKSLVCLFFLSTLYSVHLEVTNKYIKLAGIA